MSLFCVCVYPLILQNKFYVVTNLIDHSQFDHWPVHGVLPFPTTLVPAQPLPDSPRGEEEEVTMSYRYPKYNEKPDAEAHIRAFLTTWQANHVSQQLSVADADASKITEFGLSLEGHVVNWYSQYDQGEFSSFNQLSEKFGRLFHRRVAQKESVGEPPTQGEPEVGHS